MYIIYTIWFIEYNLVCSDRTTHWKRPRCLLNVYAQKRWSETIVATKQDEYTSYASHLPYSHRHKSPNTHITSRREEHITLSVRLSYKPEYDGIRLQINESCMGCEVQEIAFALDFLNKHTHTHTSAYTMNFELSAIVSLDVHTRSHNVCCVIHFRCTESTYIFWSKTTIFAIFRLQWLCVYHTIADSIEWWYSLSSERGSSVTMTFIYWYTQCIRYAIQFVVVDCVCIGRPILAIELELPNARCVCLCLYIQFQHVDNSYSRYVLLCAIDFSTFDRVCVCMCVWGCCCVVRLLVQSWFLFLLYRVIQYVLKISRVRW